MNKPQEQFRYNTQREKDLVNEAFKKSPKKVRCHFIRDMVLRVCKLMLKK